MATISHLSTMASSLRKQKNDILSRPSNVVDLRQEHFALGTVVIAPDYYVVAQDGSSTKIAMNTSRCVFRLQESIVFDPHAPDVDTATASDVWNSSVPLAGQLSVYDPAAFGIGFFSAIAISASQVVLDLNGYGISQGPSHYLHQRFYAHIELADRPFIPAQGPHDFGPVLRASHGVYVINGTLGASSHHGVHGNQCRNVLIQDITFRDYEVATIHINEGKNIAIEDIVSTNSCDNCPVVGLFSAGRFIRPYLDALMNGSYAGAIQGKDIGTIRSNLQDSLYRVWTDVVKNRATTGGRISKEDHLAEWAAFHNMSGLIDGNPYGIAINGRGVAVFGFPADLSTVTRNVWIKNVTLSNHKGHIRETPSLKVIDDSGVVTGHSQNDPVGALFQTQNVDGDGQLVTIDSSGIYVGNVVSDAQLIVAKAIHDNFDFGSLSTKRNSITPVTIQWANGETGRESLRSTISDSGVAIGTYSFNGDSMFHVNKGVIGLKLDGGSHVHVANCKMYGISNTGAIGLTQATLPVPVSTSYDTSLYELKEGKSHPKATLYGYHGSDTRAVSISSSEYVTLNNLTMDDISCDSGVCCGIDILHSSTDITITSPSVTNVSAGKTLSTITPWLGNPTSLPEARAFRADKTSKHIRIKKPYVEGVTAKTNACLLETCNTTTSLE